MNQNHRSFIVSTGIMAALLFSVHSTRADEPAWLAPSWGPLSPSLHALGAIGNTSGDAESLAIGHHDPSREDGSVQALELGLSLRLDWLEGFAVHALSYGADEEWENEWEEAFLKVKDLPGGFEVRGGRMLARYGKLNAQHPHAWNFVDTPLPLGRFLGEHGLLFDGGDLTWLKLDVDMTVGLTLGYGKIVEHDHAHHHEDDDHAAHDDDHDDHHHAEAIAYHDGVGYGRLFAQLRRDDFHTVEAGLSLALGDEEAGRRMMVYGIDVTYAWRENGLQPGGRAFTWTTELLYRDVESGHTDEHADDHDHDKADHADHHDDKALPGGGEFGLYSEVVYTLNRTLDLGTRVGYVQGKHELGTEKHFRISPAVTAYLDPYRRTSLRAQYNYDDFAGGVDEHTIWLQLALSWGGPEVR
ncbi:MAG TPA: hypothetical protein PKE26_02630 [Kiritimatiellia bacterium]|nr:hypothetical protein [Kiritimatiellia bacterium]HMO97984.1 hypothetical protein [Kiritimatiellia bacterium]HMP95335.1 hypothetical protein [Kiritimatiellia bacterium]